MRHKRKQKPQVIVWVDVDDVLVNFMRMFALHINEKFGKNLRPDYLPGSMGYSEVLTEEQFDLALNSLPSNWPENLKTFRGAAEFIRTLRKLGARVILITSVWAKDAPARIGNMVANKIEFDEAYFTRGAEKGAFATALIERFKTKKGKYPKSILVDDMLRNCIEFVEKVPNSVAFSLSYPYNRGALAARQRASLDLPIFSMADTASLYNAVVNFVKRS